MTEETPLKPEEIPTATPVAESNAQPTPPQKKKSGASRLFDKESRLGRFNRSAVRGLGWFVGLFALGFFAAFLLLYTPKAQDYESVLANYQQTSQQLDEAQTSLKKLQNENGALQTEIERYQMLNDTYVISEQTLQVQMALQQHDSQGAAYALKKLQSSFESYLPEVQKVDADLAKVIQGRLTVVEAELSSDTKTAQMDLETILKNLQEVKTRLQAE